MQQERDNRQRRLDLAVCLLIVLVSVLLHSLSLPIPYANAGAREEYRTETGLPYLTEMDSYLYCRLTEDLANGDISDYTLRHSRGDDPYISANATGEEGDVVMGLPILGATVYKLLSWIPGITPYHVIYWLAPFLASLTAIPVFFFVNRRLRSFGGPGRLGGLVAAVLVVTAQSFSWHTHAGFYDTDMGLSLLPCIFLLCYAEALLAKDLRSQLLWGCGSGLALCALSTFWRAYYAYFCIGAAAAFCSVVALLMARLIRRKMFRLSAVRGAAVGLAAQLLLCLPVRGLELFTDIAGILGNVGGSLANGDAAYPDAAGFVSELQGTPMLAKDYGEGTLDRILNGFAAYADGCLNALGGWPVLIVTAATAGFLVYVGCRIVFTKWTAQRFDTAAASTEEVSGDLLITAVFLGVWLCCGLFIMLKGSRFITIPVLPVGILCGLGTGFLHRYMQKKNNPLCIGIIALAVAGWGFAVRAEFGWLPCIIAGAAALAVGLLLFFTKREAMINLLAVTLVFSPCMACAGGSYSAIPDGSDTLQVMCDAIREQTEEDAVIASWWDYGYFYEYAARRLTLGDGGNFNGEWNYWLGQALMTDDLRLTKGICRMLANCGLDASHLLMTRYETEGDEYARRAAEVLLTILPMSRDDAYAVLTGDLMDAAAAEELLALTHPAEPRPVYLVLSEDMLRKVGAIGTFGLWDFSGSSPNLPYILRSPSAVTIEPGQSADIVFGDNAFVLHAERDSDGSFRNVSLVNEDRTPYSHTLRVVPLDGINAADNADPNPSTGPVTIAPDDSAIPAYRLPAGGSLTVYLREDSPSTYRCLLCDSASADSVLIRGSMLQGNALFYRSVIDLPKSDGSTSLHEVSVWTLGR